MAQKMTHEEFLENFNFKFAWPLLFLWQTQTVNVMRCDFSWIIGGNRGPADLRPPLSFK